MRYKVCIIGGSGFIGSNLTRFFLNSDYNVRIADINQPSNLSPKVEFIPCDVRNFNDVKRAVKNCDVVIHTAIIQIPTINQHKKLGYEVNFIGTQNVCKAVNESPEVKGMILSGSWHVIGERELKGNIDEGFGFRPDKVESRARLYAFSKVAQEVIVRYYDEMSDKIYGVIRMGTVLGEGMPKKTAANIFIEKGLNGEAITPFKHSMHRPMLYVDVRDICRAFEAFTRKIIHNEFEKASKSLDHVFNVYYPKPITILELAEIVKDAIIKLSNGKIVPKIEIVDTGQESFFTREDKYKISININKALKYLELEKLKHPKETINEIIKNKLAQNFKP